MARATFGTPLTSVSAASFHGATVTSFIKSLTTYLFLNIFLLNIFTVFYNLKVVYVLRGTTHHIYKTVYGNFIGIRDFLRYSKNFLVNRVVSSVCCHIGNVFFSLSF